MTNKFDQQLFQENIQVLDYLKQSRVFGFLPESVLKQLLPLSEIVHLPPGSTILSEGEMNSKVYFLIRGVVSVYSGEEFIVNLRRVGDIFGEMSIISHKPCSASVITDTHVDVFTIRSKDIGDCYEIDTEVLQNVLYRLFAAILTEKLNFTTHKAKQYEATNVKLQQTQQQLEQMNEQLKKKTRELEKNLEERQGLIDTLMEASRDLKSTQAQLVQSAKLAAIGELATGVAHELNQPLTYIRNSVQLELLEKPEDLDLRSVRDTLKMVEEGSSRMIKIINHLKDFARQTNSQMQPLNLHEVLESSLTLLREQFRLRNIQVNKNFAPDLPLILGDANQLEQVFINLLTNARDALENCDKAAITITTQHSLQTESLGKVVASVQDNGIGIGQSSLEKIFEPFFTTKAEGKGTGLGLSISYGIVQKHKGQIQVNSVKGEGTTIVTSFPAQKLVTVESKGSLL